MLALAVVEVGRQRPVRPETFVLPTATVHFSIGPDDVIVSGPRVPVAPTTVPHRFQTIGPEPVRMVDVHASPRFITEWLDEDG